MKRIRKFKRHDRRTSHVSLRRLQFKNWRKSMGQKQKFSKKIY